MEEKKKKLSYSSYYNDIIVREQPFYMKKTEDKDKKTENNPSNLKEERYAPISKQEWIK